MTKHRIVTIKHFFNRIIEPFDITKPDRVIAKNRKYYQYIHPKHIVCFDAMISDKMGNSIWYGDLDITRDLDDLIKLSKKLKKTLCITTFAMQLAISPKRVKFKSPEKVYKNKNKYYYRKGRRKDYSDY